jgi:hypothetical protein
VITDSSSLSFHYLAVITQFLITILYHKRLGSHTPSSASAGESVDAPDKKDEHTTGSYITSAIDVHKNGLLATCIEKKKKGLLINCLNDHNHFQWNYRLLDC